MEQAIDDLIEALRRQLGEDLLSVYLYGSRTQPYFQPGYSDINLLVCVADAADIYALRPALLPVWAQHCDVLRRRPAVACTGAVARHLRFAPLLGRHFAEDAQLLWGADSLPEPEQEPDPAAWCAYLARESLLGSIALAPELIDPSLLAPAYRRLHRVARILASAPFDGEPPAPVLFAHIQTQLRKLAGALSGDDEPLALEDATAPNLEGIYGETDRMIVLLPPLSFSLLRSLDWQAIAERLAARYNLLEATTADQLLLIQYHETAADFALGRYRHVWGEAPLDGLKLPLRAVLETAGRVPSRLLVEEIGGDYLTAADDEALHILVHDYQNRLLNVRLQHELLHRAHGLAAASPPEPLPSRDAPLEERIRALSEHFDWWAAYYADQLEKAETTTYIGAL